jgi:hypothetical protein
MSIRAGEPLLETRTPGSAQARPLSRSRAGLRLLYLHLTSRHVPAVLVALAGCGLLLRVTLSWHRISGGQQLPLLLEAGAAALVALGCGSPFGEPERASGRWLPWLRFGAALGLTAAAFCALAAGATGTHLAAGDLALARNLVGMAGIGLLAGVVLGGALAWIGPMAYAVLSEVALGSTWKTPWMWPTRPTHDAGAALCSVLVFVAGLMAITVKGARDSVRE